jgi:hypothetical protein
MSSHVIDKARWQSMSIFWQLGNIGSEVGRSARAYLNGDTEGFQAAFARGIDLFDATVEGLVKTGQSARTREVLLSRDQFVSQFFSDTPKVEPSIEEYFMQFAVADRMKR